MKFCQRMLEINSEQKDWEHMRILLLFVLSDSDSIDSVPVSNGKLYAYEENPDRKFAKIECVTTPAYFFKLGIQAVNYEQLGLTKYMVP